MSSALVNRMKITDALPRCFPLPRWVAVGNQRWTLSCSAMQIRPAGTIRLLLRLSSPDGRFREARLSLEIEQLLAGQYDASHAAAAITRWLPNSDASDVLELDASAVRALREASPLPDSTS